MKFCPKCGKELGDEAVICPACCLQQPQKMSEKDRNSFAWAFLGFCLPFVGIILYVLWNTEFPKKAKSILKGTLISLAVGAMVFVFFIIAYFIFAIYMGFELMRM